MELTTGSSPVELAPTATPPSARARGIEGARGAGSGGPAWLGAPVCALLATAAALSWLWNGFYSYTTWAPIALGALAVLVAIVILVPLRLTRLAQAAVGALLALLAWTALSITWADSIDRAWTETERVGLYAALLLASVLAARTRLAGRLAIGAIGLGASAMALYVTVRLLTPDGPELFVKSRLHEPLGYANAEAAFLLVGLWAVLPRGESERSAVLRGLAVGMATLFVELLVLTQSRAVVPAVLCSLGVVLVAAPGRVRRAWMLIAVAGGTAVAAPALLDVYSAARVDGLPPDDVTRTAGLAALGGAAAAGVVWAVASSATVQSRLRLGRRAGVAGLAVLALAGASATAVAIGDPRDEAREQWQRFTTVEANDDNTTQRFTDPRGFRYQLWQIALHQFRDHPVKGVGAGNYESTYYRERTVSDYVRQPHSTPIQLLGELGLVGALAFVAFAVAVLAAAFPRSGRPQLHEPRVRLAALGIFTVWLVHTSVDWLWNLPGITAMALVSAGILLAGPLSAEHGPRPTGDGRAVRTAVVAATLVAVVAMAASIGRHYVAAVYRDRAEDALARDPADARADALRALELNRHDVGAYYVLSAAEARFDRYEEARGALLAAAGEESFNYVPWVLLGDLATKRGDRAQAQRDYAHAKRLNPGDRLIVPTPP